MTRTTSPITTAIRSVRERARRTFSSLKVRNYRLYFIGQMISLCGTWMQSIAQGLLVLRLTGSGTALGVVMGLQFAPVLVLAPYGGVLADRLPKRRLLIFTQVAAGVLALALGILVVTGAVRLWMLYVLALALGVINAIDNPTRQTFVHELVGAAQLQNAVGLNSIIVNVSRVIGPAIAGVLVAKAGLAWCFILNGVSFGAVVVCLARMRVSDLKRSAPVEAVKGQTLEGFSYAWRTPVVRTVLLMMALVGTLSYEFSVSLPLLAHYTFNGSEAAVASAVALMMTTMGIGAVVGGLVTAGRRTATMRALTFGAFGFGIAMALVAVAPTIVWASVAMAVVGYFSVAFTAHTNTILQTSSAPQMRGRVMALWAMAFMGATVIGAPIIGWVGQHVSPQWGLGIGAAASLVAGVIGLTAQRARGVVEELPQRRLAAERESA